MLSSINFIVLSNIVADEVSDETIGAINFMLGMITKDFCSCEPGVYEICLPGEPVVKVLVDNNGDLRPYRN